MKSGERLLGWPLPAYTFYFYRLLVEIELLSLHWSSSTDKGSIALKGASWAKLQTGEEVFGLRK